MNNTPDPGDLTPEESERIQAMRLAFEQEFAASSETEEGASSRKQALKDIEDLKPDALTALKWIMLHSDSDTLKAKVAMWTYDKLLERSKEDGGLGAFFEGMDAASKSAANRSS